MLLGGNAEPDLLEDIYDAVESGNFDVDLLERIDEAINNLVGDALVGGGVSGATKEDIVSYL